MSRPAAGTHVLIIDDDERLNALLTLYVERMVSARIHNVQQSQEGGRQEYTATELLEFADNSRSFC